MADNTLIEWADATWNPITGCTVLSAGCANCYAMKIAGSRLRHHPSRIGLTTSTKAGPVWNGIVRFNDEWLDQPLRWSRARMIFVCAHGDLFHPDVPDEWIDRVFDVMEDHRSRHHVFQVLTKRADRMRDYLRERWRVAGVAHFYGLPADAVLFAQHPNIWCGVSIENQAAADAREDALAATPAKVRFVSCEPLLGHVQLRRPDAIDWMIVGGENGDRPMHPDWARSLRDQCAAAGVPFFFKQWGSWFPYGGIDADGKLNSLTLGERPGLWHEWPAGGGFSVRLGKKRAGRFLDGVTHDAMPEIAA